VFEVRVINLCDCDIATIALSVGLILINTGQIFGAAIIIDFEP
jgi:hypothetical protein